jgi:transposase-like protein
MEMSGSGKITENADGSFSVPSQSKEGLVYEVRAIGNNWVCTCPDFETRADTISACKHIHATKFWIATHSYIQDKPKPKVFADDAIQCDSCGSIRHIDYGTYKDKKVFKCKDCGHKFREGFLKKAKYSAEMITLTLDLYFSGLSLRKIVRTVNDHFGLNLGAASIYRWIQKYIPLISDYVNSLSPQLSETWHADELFVKMKGGQTYKGDTNLAFVWNVMDRETRFLLASKLSKARDSGAATRAFMEASKNAHSNPQRVVTDALSAYRDGVRFGFSGKKPLHIANAGIRKKPHATNNRIERQNGTQRERVKVQRGWKSMKTPLPEGQRIHNNFVKPHMALNGQTPAEAAGIGVGKGNKWGELLKEATK